MRQHWMWFTGLVIPAFFFSIQLEASQAVSQTFSLDGQLFRDTSSENPLLDTGILTIQILSADQSCVLYEETQPFDTRASDGFFNVRVGSEQSAAKRNANLGLDSNYAMSRVYSNASSFTGYTTAGVSCTYAPGPTDRRFVRVQVTTSDNVSRLLSPNLSLDAVPTAIVAERAETLQGFAPENFLQLNRPSHPNLTQSNVESVFDQLTGLTSLLNGSSAQYARASEQGVLLPSPATAPTTPSEIAAAAGKIWYDGGTLKYSNGTQIKTLDAAGTSFTLNVGTGLKISSGGTVISDAGRTIEADTGITAGKLIKLNASAQLPAVSGANLTELNASEIQSGQISGSTSVSTTGSIVTSSSVTGNTLYARDGAGLGTGYVGLSVPNTVTTSYVLKLPPQAPTDGQILRHSTNKQLEWIDFAISSSLDLPQGKIWIGNSSGKAYDRSISGDIELAADGKTKIVSIQDHPIHSSMPAIGQVYKYVDVSGVDKFKASYINPFDLRSAVTPTVSAFPATMVCGASKTMKYVPVDDTFDCVDIAIGASQIDATSAAATFALVGGQSGALALGTKDAQALTMKTSDLARLTIDKDGLVGIGNTAPTKKLDVTGAVKATEICIDADCRTTWPTSSSGGTVTSVTAGTGLTSSPAAGITTSGSLAVDTGTTTGKIIQVIAGNKLPAIDASNLTALNATNLTSGTVPAAQMPALTGDVTTSIGTLSTSLSAIKTKPLLLTSLSSDQFLKYDGTNWINVTLSSASLSDGSSLIKSSQMPTNCGAGQTLTFSSPTGSWVCSNLVVTASNFDAQVQKTFLAGPTSGSDATPTFRAIASTDLPSTLTSALWVANGADIYRSSGNVGIGTAAPNAVFQVAGSTTVLARFTNTGPQGTLGGAGMIGSQNSGAAMSDGNRLGFYLLGGAKDSANNEANTLGMIGYATENWSSTATGSRLGFETTANGTTNRTEKMTILGNGNVGIGTSAPAVPLEVVGAATFTGNLTANQVTSVGSISANYYRSLGGNAATPGYAFTNDTTSGMFKAGTNQVGLAAGGVEGLRVIANGNVGIGTTSPVGVLDVRGGTAAANTAGTAITVIGQSSGTGTANAGGGIVLTGGSGSAAGGAGGPVTITAGSPVSGAGGEVTLTASAAVGTNQNGGKVIITAGAKTGTGTAGAIGLMGGNVGVGTSTPTAFLDVTGASNSGGAGAVVTNTDAGTGARATVSAKSNVATTSIGATSGSFTPNWQRENQGFLSSNATYGLDLVSLSTVGTIRMMNGHNATPLERMRITNTGDVGIGVTAPTQKLDVAGAVNATGFTINGMPIGTSTSSYWNQNGANVYFNTGNVGIGTATPAYDLDVNGVANLGSIRLAGNGTIAGNQWLSQVSGEFLIGNNSNSAGAFTKVSGGKGSGTHLDLYSGSGGTVSSDYIAFFTGNAEKVRITTNGSVGIGTSTTSEKLEVAGNIKVNSTYTCVLGTSASGATCSSDERLKTDIKTLPGALEKILNLRGVEFQWRENNLARGRHDIGVIAQEVEAQYPTAVKVNSSNGFKMVDYGALVAPLIEAVKALTYESRKTSAALEEEVTKLRKDNERLESDIAAMKKYLCAKDAAAPGCEK